MFFAIPTQRTSANRNDFLDFQKDTGRDTILILVYIHTYPVFARRINIVQRKRATRTYDKQNTSSDHTCISETLSACVTLKLTNLYR